MSNNEKFMQLLIFAMKTGDTSFVQNMTTSERRAFAQWSREMAVQCSIKIAFLEAKIALENEDEN